MTRRRVLLAVASARFLLADEAEEVRDLFGELASGLSEGNPAAFLSRFDRAMPGYDRLAVDVAALLEQAEVQCAIEVLRDEGTEDRREVELDWFLQIVEQQAAGGAVRRREQVRAVLKRVGKKWRIMAMEPLSVFAPPRAAR